MITTNTVVVLDREDADRLSKLIEWAAQFVTSPDHITVQDAEQFVRDWNARGPQALPRGNKGSPTDDQETLGSIYNIKSNQYN